MEEAEPAMEETEPPNNKNVEKKRTLQRLILSRFVTAPLPGDSDWNKLQDSTKKLQIEFCHLWGKLWSRTRNEFIQLVENKRKNMSTPIFQLVINLKWTVLQQFVEESVNFNEEEELGDAFEQHVRTMVSLLSEPKLRARFKKDTEMRLLHTAWAEFSEYSGESGGLLPSRADAGSSEGAGPSVKALLRSLVPLIEGLSVPVRPMNRSLLFRAILPLCKSQHLSRFAAEWQDCVAAFLKRDGGLVKEVVSALLRYWPHRDSKRQMELLFPLLGGILEVVEAEQLQTVMVLLHEGLLVDMFRPNGNSFLAMGALSFMSKPFICEATLMAHTVVLDEEAAELSQQAERTSRLSGGEIGGLDTIYEQDTAGPHKGGAGSPISSLVEPAFHPPESK